MKPKYLLLTLPVVIGAGWYLGLSPYRLAGQERERAADQVEATRAIERKREALIRRDAELRSTHGREALARKNGYRKPGEVAAPPVPVTP